MAKETVASPIKHFVLDTNVLLHNPGALFAFADNHVIIPFDVLEELDKFKKDSTDVGRSARSAIRFIDGLREKGHLDQGVKWNGHGGMIQVAMNGTNSTVPGLSPEKADNRIIAVAYHLKQQGKNAIFISKDINARIKSTLPRHHHRRLRKPESRLRDSLLRLSRADRPRRRDRSPLCRQNKSPSPIRSSPLCTPKLNPNEYVLLKVGGEESQTGLARYVPAMQAVLPLSLASKNRSLASPPRNLQQIMALDLLLDDDVQMVTLMGTAGTGKTLLALAAGMYKCFQEGGGGGSAKYERLLVARPIMPLGKDIGFLPGSKDEKLSAWMKPIFDNLDFLLTDRRVHSGETSQRRSQIERAISRAAN